MKLITLVENTACREGLCAVHGLSQYIETARHKLLLDVGPDESFLQNAAALGVDLTAVDTVILSHGHYDHTGGLAAFFAVNSHATVYLRRAAFGPHYSCVGERAKYIGMDPALLERYESRFSFTDEVTVLDEELTLFSRLATHDYPTAAGTALRYFDGADYRPDDFRHEQNLLITQGEQRVLLCGCAHGGIVNILRAAEAIIGRSPDAVFGGFHLFNPTTGAAEDETLLDAVASELLQRPCRYYTGHCTGMAAYDYLRSRLGERIGYMAAGTSFTI